MDREVIFCHYFSFFLTDATTDVASVGCSSFSEFGGESVYREIVCKDLDESPFVFCSLGGGFEEFADVMSPVTTAVSYQEVSGFSGGDRFCLGVFSYGGRVCVMVVFYVVFEPFPSSLPDIYFEGFFALFGGGLAQEFCPSIWWSLCRSYFQILFVSCFSHFCVDGVFPSE